LAIAGFCDKLQIINTSTGQVSQQLNCPSIDSRAIAFSSDGTRMAVAGRNGQIRLWNVVSGALDRDIPAGRQRIRSLAFSPDGSQLASAGDGVTIYVLNLFDGNQDIKLAVRPAKVHSVVFLNNQSFAIGGSDNSIHVWDLDSRVVVKTLTGHTGSVSTLACDSAGTTLVSGSYDTTVRIWHLGDNHVDAVARTPGEATR
jgi:WD40 repeat protein